MSDIKNRNHSVLSKRNKSKLLKVTAKVLVVMCVIPSIIGCSSRVSARTPEGPKSELMLHNMLTLKLTTDSQVTGSDSDGDGLSDAYERQLGLDEYNPDTDLDAISDMMEHIVYKTDPLTYTNFDDTLYSFMRYKSTYGTTIKFVGKGEDFPTVKTSNVKVSTNKTVLSEPFTIEGVSKEDYCVVETTYKTMKHLKSDVFKPTLYEVKSNGELKPTENTSTIVDGQFVSEIYGSGTYVIVNDTDSEIQFTLQTGQINPTLKLTGYAVNTLPVNYHQVSPYDSGIYQDTNIGTTNVALHKVMDFSPKYIVSGTIEFDMGDEITEGMEIVNITNLQHPNYTLHPNKRIEGTKLIADFSQDTNIITVLDLNVIREKQNDIANKVKSGSKVDSDNDGLSDLQEDLGFVLPNGYHVTFDKNNPDTDNDGILDGNEIILGVND